MLSCYHEDVRLCKKTYANLVLSEAAKPKLEANDYMMI